ncbi:Uncharacterized protein SCF082_LOCUS23837 [Durusdinium trenchii]|uniref:Uncharacterized protein n=1 Tax=Durusdinium trenchii TaxID=1381693 RepID=A0ABP0LPQ8_9DINO
MSTLLDSTEALKKRALEVHLTEAEVTALVANGVVSLAQLAFAAAGPGQTASDEQIRNLFLPHVTTNMETLASMKRLIFEAQTMVAQEMKTKVARKEETSVLATLAPAERDTRIEAQRKRLQGLLLRGDEEVAHACYDLVLNLLDKDTLVYLGPEKFYTRKTELLQKKPPKELSIDQNSLIIKDKSADHTCSAKTELELVQALRRRALAFDLVGACSYEVMNRYHSELVQHLQEDPPPGYHPITVAQILRADRAAFLHIAERLTSLRRTAAANSLWNCPWSTLSHTRPSAFICSPWAELTLPPLQPRQLRSPSHLRRPKPRPPAAALSPSVLPTLATARAKESDPRAEARMFPRHSSARRLRMGRVNAFAGPTTLRVDAQRPLLAKSALEGFTFAPSPDVGSLTPCRNTLDYPHRQVKRGFLHRSKPRFVISLWPSFSQLKFLQGPVG